jgi:hypothetical protein
VQNQLKPLFVKAALSDFEKDAVLERIGEMVDTKLAGNQLYQSLYDSILKMPAGEAREKALTKHMLLYTNEILGPIAAEVIRKAKAGTLSRQDATQSKVDEQKRTSAADPRGTPTSATRTAQVSTPKDLRNQIITEYKAAHGGDEPDTEYVIAESWKRTQAAAKGPRRA